jgi:hypothetical protein
MDSARLQKLLEELHRELSGATALDVGSRKMLDQVLEDVRRLGGPPRPDQDAGDLTAQLREAALRIEAEHPRLANALGQLTDTLAKLGI